MKKQNFAVFPGLFIVIAAFAAEAAQTPADYQGNRTIISVPSPRTFGLVRESDCSLTLNEISYTQQIGVPSYSVLSTVPDYQRQLHSLAGLTTTPDLFNAGCPEANAAAATTSTALLIPKTNDGVQSLAARYYDGALKVDRAMVLNAKADFSFKNMVALSSPHEARGIAAGDFNADGNSDVITVNMDFTGTAPASVSVFMRNADGSFKAPVTIELSGRSYIGGVIADFNNDNRADIVVTTSTDDAAYQLAFIAGKGDGGFQPVVTTTLTPPVGAFNLFKYTAYNSLIAGDLRGLGRKDIVSAEGIVLLNNGDGSFNQLPQSVFNKEPGSQNESVTVVAGDFNKDGKLDLAAGSPGTINIYTGHGDGSFSKSQGYANISSDGVMAASDLDGDGNIDLYSGIAGGRIFTGNLFDLNLAYVLMGNGDGSFAGAPVLPFGLTGDNLADLNADGKLDAVTTNSDFSFTSYLGDAEGNFALGSNLATPFTDWRGSPLKIESIDSYALGDVDGDGKADLVLNDADYTGMASGGLYLTPGFFLARGNGDGSFASANFIAAPSFVPIDDIDIGLKLTHLQLADVNNDGKDDLLYDYADRSYKTGTYYVGSAEQLSNGAGGFGNAQDVPYYSGQIESPNRSNLVLAADVNKDGYRDLLFLTENGQRPTFGEINRPCDIQLRLGDGRGQFGNAVTILGPELMSGLLGGRGYSNLHPGSYLTGLSIADMNGDGKPDLVAAGSSATNKMQVAIAIGNGDGSFKVPVRTTYDASYEFATIAIADFNKDGKADVALVSIFGGNIDGISFGNGDGSLQTVDGLPSRSLPFLSGGVTQALEVNGDDTPDIFSGSVAMLSIPPVNIDPGNPATTITLKTSAAYLVAGKTVSLTAKVTTNDGKVIKKGNVTFSDGGTVIGQVKLSKAGVATLSAKKLVAGDHQYSAKYNGAEGYSAAISPETVVKAINGVGNSAYQFLNQQDSPDPVQVAKATTYRIKFFNYADSNVTEVNLKDVLPSGANLVSTTASQGSCGNNLPVICALGTVQAGATVFIDVSATLNKRGKVKNKASVSYKYLKPGTKKAKTFSLNHSETTTVLP